LSVLIKLDENLGNRGKQLLIDAGHDVATVAEQGLSGADDRAVIEVCGRERRCLVTLDLDFSNPFVFAPGQYSGIAVLRPRRLTPEELFATVTCLATALGRSSIDGKLWTVERHRIREYLPETENENDPRH
jgi:predicted nuclease of predicted toxin-antitoxin system